MPTDVGITYILESLGWFLLYPAMEYASAENVQAESLIRQGVAPEVQPIVVSQTDATRIVIGNSIGDPGHLERSKDPRRERARSP